MSDFVDDLAGTGGSVPSARIRAWIEMRRASSSAAIANASDPEDLLASA